MGAYRSVAPRGSIASLPQELCVSEDCDDDDVVALERWRRDRKRFSLRTAGSHSRLQVGDGVARICYCAPGLTT